MKRLFNTGILYVLFFLSVNGQIKENVKLIQVSGIITGESETPLSDVLIISKKLNRGSLSKKTGIYSITSTPGDTVSFRALGFKTHNEIIPATIRMRHYNADIIMELDTIQIDEVTILPWNTYYEFISDITTRELPEDPEIGNLHDNLVSIYAGISNETGVEITPEAGYKYATDQYFNTMSTRNQYPVNNLLNPFAWSKFFNSLKNGLFRNKTYNKPTTVKVRKKKKRLVDDDE